MNKLWFVGTLKRTFLDQYRVGSYNPDGTQFVDDNKMVTYTGKLSYALSSSSQLHYSYLYSNKQRFHRSGNSLTDFYDGAATHLQELEGHLNQARWTKTLSQKMVLDVSGSNIKNYQPQVPRPEVQPGAIARFDSLRRTFTTAQAVYEVSRDRRTVAHASLSYFTGSHDIKAGFQWDNGRYYAENFSTSGMRAVYRNGAPDSVNTYNTPVSRTSYVQDTAVFVQDKWSATRKLTFNVGLRIEKFRGWQPEVCQVETQFVGGTVLCGDGRCARLAGSLPAVWRDLRHQR